MKLKAMVNRFKPYKDWYADDWTMIKEQFKSDKYLFAGLLAATSPRIAVKRSWDLSTRLYNQYKAGIEPDFTGLLPCHIGNVKRVLSGQELSGPKVRRFYQNLTGNLSAVTIDVWMIRWLSDGKESAVKAKDYKRLEKNFKRRARAYDLEPAELQAIVWTAYRFEQGKKHRSYVTVSEHNQPKFNFMNN